MVSSISKLNKIIAKKELKCFLAMEMVTLSSGLQSKHSLTLLLPSASLSKPTSIPLLVLI